MNFLSHFYFDCEATDCYFVLGTVLPDLLKNADKRIVLHPEKLHHTNPAVNSIVAGWNKHLDVDKHFHSSNFFITHSHQLKKELLPAITGSPVKPFFLGHIAVELIIDNLLLTTGEIMVGDFYDHLKGCDNEVIDDFLVSAGLKDTTRFFRFFEGFKRDKYLNTYSETEQIAYALKRICMRIWDNPFTPQHEAQMNKVVINYRERLLPEFMSIFSEIESKL
ncbi:hypothetical protein ACFS5N_16135 [Mucilaginibacter ximonensis]|uniref:Acyl carrier protein phosphodiesterase n=1 Tax=Mucilaginibacter ximonensis TaxID=538021 RepID=A0ABW5YFF6_9SPHI